MTLLALDLGTTTGWALCTPDARIVSGTMSFKPGRFEGGGMRYLRFRRWLAELRATTEGEMVAAARARGHTPGDDNEADALALLAWAAGEAGAARTDARRSTVTSQSTTNAGKHK